MLSVNEVSQSYGGRSLFENVSVTFPPGRRFGLTGPNGAGKSTFMKFLAGDAEPQKGSVSRPRKTSILRQNQHAYEQYRVLDVVMMGNQRLWAAMEEKNAILKRAEDGEEFTEEMGMRLGDLEGIVGEEVDHPTLQKAAVAAGDIYGAAQASQPAFFYMEQYRRELKQRVRRILSDLDIPQAKDIRDAIDEFAAHAYAEHH